MKILLTTAAAVAMLGLAACGDNDAAEQNAENIVDAAENQADMLDEMADNATSENAADALENQADQVRENAENAADAAETADTNGM